MNISLESLTGLHFIVVTLYSEVTLKAFFLLSISTIEIIEHIQVTKITMRQLFCWFFLLVIKTTNDIGRSGFTK